MIKLPLKLEGVLLANITFDLIKILTFEPDWIFRFEKEGLTSWVEIERYNEAADVRYVFKSRKRNNFAWLGWWQRDKELDWLNRSNVLTVRFYTGKFLGRDYHIHLANGNQYFEGIDQVTEVKRKLNEQEIAELLDYLEKSDVITPLYELLTGKQE